MTDTLPPLPKPGNGSIQVGREEISLGYDIDQMRAYAEEAVRLEREACAVVCESTYPELVEGQLLAMRCFDTPDECAAAIRARSKEG